MPDLPRQIACFNQKRSRLARLWSWLQDGPSRPFDPAYHNEVFVDHWCDLTGQHVRFCHFDGCIIVLNGNEDASIKHSTFKNCRFYGDLALSLQIALGHNV